MTATQIAARIQDRIAREFAPADAVRITLCEVGRSAAASYAAEVLGVDVRKSWTVARIASAAAAVA